MSKVWLISDTHFCHKNIIKYCGRPANCDLLMWEGLKQVGADDTLIHVGDVVLASHVVSQSTVLRLPGKYKILMVGNHDKRVKVHKMEGWDETYPPSGQPYGSYRWHNCPIWLSHRPQPNMDRGGIFIHGHIHEKGDRLTWTGDTLIVNACVEHWDYKPIDLSELYRIYMSMKSVPCVEPEAPVVPCVGCGKDVHTCERTADPGETLTDYTCPAHPNGFEWGEGVWYCSDRCFEQKNPEIP